jgi:hypothetical protein
MTDQVKPASRPWRRFLRFNARGLIVLVLVIGAVLGWIVRTAHIQRDAVAAIEKAGGLTFYNIPRTPVVSWHEPSRWRTLVGGYIGIDYAGHVCHVNFPQITPTGNDADRQGAVARVGDLGQLETLDFAGMSVTDGDLASLDGLNRLQQLVLPKRLCVILGRRDSCRTVSGVNVPPMPVPSGQIEPYFGHELLHSRAPVVSCDVVVQVLPDSFDAIVVRAIRWQEVQPYLAGCRRLQCQSDLLAVVDAVVVENEMDPTSVPVRLGHEFVKEVQKQEAVLPVPFDPCELAGFGIESAGEITLLVASRSADVLSPPGQRPLRPKLGIEVNVNFVEVQNDLTRSEVVNQPLNRPQSPRPTRSPPGAVDGRLGPIQPNSRLSEEPAHRGDANANPCSFGEHQNQQFLCPRGAPVAVVLR